MSSPSKVASPIVPRDGKGYPFKLNWYLIWCTLWGGFVHFTVGYDSGVVGGLFTKTSFLKKFYPNFSGRKDSPYCQWTSNDLAIYSMLLYPPMILGCFVCGFMMRRWGRPVGVFLTGLFNIVGAIVQITASNSSILLLGRCLNGLGEGFGMFVYNIYLAEIAPAQLRGKIVGTSVTWSASGVLFGQLVNYLVFQRSNGWQISLAMVMVPSGLLCINSFIMTDTPVSLLVRGRREDALRSLQKYRGVQEVDEELRDIEQSVHNRISTLEGLKLVARNKQYWPGLIINLVMYTFLTWTGNTAIVYYGPQIFSLLGFGSSVALWNSLVVGGAKIFGVFIGVYLLDTRLVRRKLLVWGGVLQTLFLVATAIVFAVEVQNVKGAQVSKGIAAVILVLIIIYEIAFMGGQHVPTLGMAAEVVPIEVRHVVFPINMVAYATQSMAISYAFTFMLCGMVWGTFLFFAGLTFLLIFWAWFFMPETHHVPLERVHTVMAGHKVWHSFFSPPDAEAGTKAGGLELADSMPRVDSLKKDASGSDTE